MFQLVFPYQLMAQTVSTQTQTVIASNTAQTTTSGALYAISTNPQITTAVINATNILNQQTGLLSSILPASILSTLTNPVAHLNLNLNAIQNIINQGIISSSGNLAATAGGAIINAGLNGSTAVMQALNNI